MPQDSYQTPDIKSTEKFYRRAQWWIGHREGLRRMLLGLWIVFDVFLVLFTLWVFTDAFLIQYERERSLVRSLLVENQTAFHANAQRQAAVPLRVDTRPQVFDLGGGEYDLYFTVGNENSDWWAQVLYRVTYGDETLGPFVSFVYPEEEKPFVHLAVESDTAIRSPQVVVDDVVWRRIDPHVLPDFSFWRSERENFVVTNTEFTPDVQLGDERVSRVIVDIENASAYGYWNPEFVIVLKRGASTVGVTRTALDQFEPGETRTITLNWFTPLAGVSSIEVTPTIQLFNPGVYMPLEGGTPLDTRLQIGQ